MEQRVSMPPFFPRKQTSRAKEETVLEHNETQMQGFEYSRKNKEAETYTCRSCLQKMENKPGGSPCVFAFDDPKKTFIFHH
jgi:hypothetical protein